MTDHAGKKFKPEELIGRHKMRILRPLETIIVKGSPIRFSAEVPESRLRKSWERVWSDKSFPSIAAFILAEEDFNTLSLVLGPFTSDEKEPVPFGMIDDDSHSLCGMATFDSEEQKYIIFIRKLCIDRKDGLDSVVTHELAHIARGDIGRENRSL